MASLPTVGADNGTWGTKLNEYLSVEHNTDGTHDTATESTTGTVQLASTSEATTGTNTTKAVTPAGNKAALAAGGTVLVVADAGATETLNPNLYSGSDITLTVACVLSIAAITTGGNQHTYSILVRQSGAGGFALTWPAAVNWDSDVAPTATTTTGTATLYGMTTLDGGTTWIASMIATGATL